MHIISSSRVKILLFALSLSIIGYCFGNHLGSHIITRLISGENSFLLALYKPAFEYINTINLLESNNELKRLTGYYSLLDNKKIDVDFLIDKYKREELIYIKRSIIWLLGYSNKKRKAINFLSEIYKDASLRVKLEVLRSIKRIDRESFNKFIIDQKIDKDLLMGI